ncbi:MAG: aminotransferase class I/II-fold pyridoxal phosphate-dependent enzyme [Lachnospiraceae bacterium]|nr:aminotransferase class I/II-fold pyridoxal phosphate-dependent enzyme [Lachnospiraceae bacterium]
MGRLREQLEEYAGSGMLPFHMPGHKRLLPGEFFRTDVTELKATDDLHAPEGILKEAQERAARLYGADHTFFLVNGSTAGVLAAMSAGVRKGAKILMQRASHRSAYHAVILRELRPVYLYGAKSGAVGEASAAAGHPLPEAGDPGVVSAEELETALVRNPDAEAVFLTSPTYEGYSADLERAAQLCHARGIPLIVDAAHGAHFGFHPALPESAVQAGADLVIMSVHKTLPSPTQTALLHMQGELINPERVQAFLSIYQTSSPSYPLMAAIDDCMEYLEKGGSAIWEEFLARRAFLDRMLKETAYIRIDSTEPCKLLLYPEDGQSGIQLAEALREHGIEPEMSLPAYVLLILSVMDTEEMYGKLAEAVHDCDRAYALRKSIFPPLRFQCLKGREKLRLSEAWEAEREQVSEEAAEGRISAAFVMAYPPGRPILVPGERITGEHLDEIRKLRAAGCVLYGVD